MVHVSREELLRATEAGRAEIARMASHLSVCTLCRALASSLLRERAIPEKREVPLKTLLELAKFERETAVEQLLARAELIALGTLPRGAQKERIIKSRSCHTFAFLNALTTALRTPRSRDKAESLSNLLSMAVQSADFKSDSLKNDFLATIWIETANARRINGELTHAQTALLRAERHTEVGTGNPVIKARWLSITASLRMDQGQPNEALALLNQCLSIHEDRSEWPLFARTLVKMGHCLVDNDPERGLAMLDKASVLVQAEEAGLRWLLESTRTECLLTLGRVDDALSAFEHAELLRPLHYRSNTKLRSTFTSARVLEALGSMPEAGTLFEEVVEGDLERGFYKDTFLDLLYVFGFHVRHGLPERAADMCQRTFAEIDRHDSVVHEQLRTVWEKLIEAARAQSLDEGMLAQARDYFRTHWKYPASTEPVFAAQGRTPDSPETHAPLTAHEKMIASLHAQALWSLVKREPRKDQQIRVGRSPECHTRAFIEVLIAEVTTAGSRDASEFTASLALAAIKSSDEPGRGKHDLQARVWAEVANVRRIGAEWGHALAALRRADEHLQQGSEDKLLAARAHSIAASLHADQGNRSEAVAMLEHCRQLYEGLKAWPLVARTLIKMAHILVDIEPELGLVLIDKALPLIPAADAALRWLAESNRAECLIEMREVDPALQAFHLAETLREDDPRIDAVRRSNFTAARLLEALGHLKEAERVFDAVIADAFEYEAYREAFLDLHYLFGLHVRTGATEKALSLCRFAISQLERFEVGHEQLRRVWTELLEAAIKQRVTPESLLESRDFLSVYWNHPAAQIPQFSFR